MSRSIVNHRLTGHLRSLPQLLLLRYCGIHMNTVAPAKSVDWTGDKCDQRSISGRKNLLRM